MMRFRMIWPWRLLVLVLPLLLWACADAPSGNDVPRLTDPPGSAVEAPAAERSGQQVAALPTLLPTYTPVPTQTPIAVGPAPTTAPTATPIDFNQPVVIMRYAIPALGLDRIVEGTVSSQVTLRDNTTGQEVILSNQAAVLLQMQEAIQALAEEGLAPIPEGCDGCVLFEFDLPLADLAGSGWLQDPLLLASIENFTTAHLGLHVPAGTVVALRRSASAFDFAHTLAVDASGQTTFWLAIDSEYVPVTLAGGDQIAAAARALDPVALPPAFQANCPAVALESLWLNVDLEADPITVVIRCPELSLPAGLLPLYTGLDAAIAPQLDSLDRPPAYTPLLPLAALLYYEQPAGRLTLFADGTVMAANATISYTGVLTTASAALSLTNQLLNTGQIGGISPEIVARQGITNSGVLPPNVLLARGDLGVGGLIWSETLSSPLRPLVGALDVLLTALLAPPEPSEPVAPPPA